MDCINEKLAKHRHAFGPNLAGCCPSWTEYVLQTIEFNLILPVMPDQTSVNVLYTIAACISKTDFVLPAGRPRGGGRVTTATTKNKKGRNSVRLGLVLHPQELHC